MDKNTNIAHGVRWGTIIGLVYCVMLFLRYSQGGSSPISLALFTFIGFVVVLVMLFYCGLTRKKQLGGYIEIKEAFQTMFIAVLCFEFFYTAFNFIYLKYIDPEFFQKMKDSMEAFMIKSNMSQAKIDEALDKIDVQSSKNMNLGSSFLSYCYSVLISGVFALIFALILKKKRDPFQAPQDNFIESQQ